VLGLRFSRTLFLPHRGRLELDPRQKFIDLDVAHLRSVGAIEFAGRLTCFLVTRLR
jgi:hypothetical protein